MAQLLYENPNTPQSAPRGSRLDSSAQPRFALLPLIDEAMTLVTPGGAKAALLASALDELGREQWVAMQAPGGPLRINGLPVASGIQLLVHRDELRVPGARFYFSAEEPPRVAVYAGPADARCPRCLTGFAPGDAAVRCPRCRVWHHQRSDRGCWIYSETCALGCGRATALDAGLEWAPEEDGNVAHG